MKHLFFPGLLALSLTVFLPAGVLAQSVQPLPATPSVRTALTAEGTLRPEARGAFDTRGYALTYGADGQPVLRPQAADDINWASGFEQPGLGLDVWALAVAPNGDVYVGGQFYGAGGKDSTSYLARWDGTNWHKIGTQPLNRAVYCMALAPNGDLIVGGDFFGAPGNRIARWDGTTWHAFGTGLDNTVRSVVVMPNGNIVAGGDFRNAGGNATANRVARWDGTAWQPLGTGLSALVTCLVVLPTGDLIAGGRFLNAGGDSNADRVARWDGTAWHAMATGVNEEVNTVAVGPTGEVVLGGHFTDVGGLGLADYAVRWDGTAWQPLCPGLTAAVQGLQFLANGDLLMGGSFQDVVGTPITDYIARRSGTQWQGIGGGLDPDLGRCASPTIFGARAFAQRPGGDLLIGGSFFGTGTLYCQNLAHWSGTQWLPMGGNGHDNYVTGMVITPAGDVLVSGNSFNGGMGRTQGIGSIVRWDGTQWRQFGSGLIGSVAAIALAPNGDVIAAGDLSLTTSSQSSIVRWNGSQWQEICPRVSGEEVYRVAVASNGDVIAAGERGFGSQSHYYVSRWDGTSWQQLGPDLAVRERILTITTTSTGDILIGGEFTSYGSAAATGLARWDGAVWQPIGAGPNGNVGSIAVGLNGQLWVGMAYNGVSHWDGSSWTSLPGLSSPGDRAYVALAPNGDLLVSGPFTNAGGNPLADHIARWDGTTWHPLGSGLNRAGGVVGVKPNGDVVVLGGVGGFTATGDRSKAMYHFGIYRAQTPTGRADETNAPEAPSLQLWPNPAHSAVQVQGPGSLRRVVVVDGLGREVRHAPLIGGRGTVELAGLTPGLYVVRAGEWTRRLVVE